MKFLRMPKFICFKPNQNFLNIDMFQTVTLTMLRMSKQTCTSTQSQYKVTDEILQICIDLSNKITQNICGVVKYKASLAHSISLNKTVEGIFGNTEERVN